ncbi:gliding motility-associated ABC transporter ATP-binding subunit GldA [Vicingaceae bacterium]|jgi:ABC-2 type transport system ATP-binding protein|nr:gliding motility-associated ABC transporter ATP-binding subunit GldA [Vicingaceae bacterium]
MSIKVENISKLYGKQRALNDVSFEVKPGEIVGFLGPNGAGKSTMMKIITTYLPASEGKVSVCGIDVNEDALGVRNLIGYLPEHNPLYLDMYVRESIAFVAQIHKIKPTKKLIDNIIEKVGLQVEQNKKIGELSKGYRQRVGLAQALIHDPKVLILDEPTTGLDPNQLAEIRNLIKTVGKEKTVMLSTHIMQEVEAICDRVMIINKGELVANKSAKELTSIATKKIVITVEFEGNIDEKKLISIAGVTKMEKIGNNTFQIESDAKTDLRNTLFNFAVNQGASVLTLQKEHQKLEDVFKELTKQK